MSSGKSDIQHKILKTLEEVTFWLGLIAVCNVTTCIRHWSNERPLPPDQIEAITAAKQEE